jgi:hypothetical protein
MAENRRIQFLGERAHALLKRFALIGEGELRASLTGRFGDTPGDRAVIGNPKDEAAFAREDSGSFSLDGRTFGLRHSSSGKREGAPVASVRRAGSL